MHCRLRALPFVFNFAQTPQNIRCLAVAFILELAPMAAHREHFQRLADECIALSVKSDTAHSASELRRISYRLLQLADPTLPHWEEDEDIPEFNPWQTFGTA
jgi:hypothetical protein